MEKNHPSSRHLKDKGEAQFFEDLTSDVQRRLESCFATAQSYGI